MGEIVASWLGLLLGLSGIGTVLAFVVRFVANASGGLR